MFQGHFTSAWIMLALLIPIEPCCIIDHCTFTNTNCRHSNTLQHNEWIWIMVGQKMSQIQQTTMARLVRPYSIETPATTSLKVKPETHCNSVSKSQRICGVFTRLYIYIYIFSMHTEYSIYITVPTAFMHSLYGVYILWQSASQTQRIDPLWGLSLAQRRRKCSQNSIMMGAWGLSSCSCQEKMTTDIYYKYTYMLYTIYFVRYTRFR